MRKNLKNRSCLHDPHRLFSPFYYVNWRLVAQVFAVCRENLIEVTQGDDDVDEDDLEAPSNAIKLSYDITYYLFLL